MSQALDTLREKLGYLQQQEAIVADPAQKFALAAQIKETKARIAELDVTTLSQPFSTPSAPGNELAHRGDTNAARDAPAQPELYSPIRRVSILSVIYASIPLSSIAAAAELGHLGAFLGPLPVLFVFFGLRAQLLPRFSTYSVARVGSALLLYLVGGIYWLLTTEAGASFLESTAQCLTQFWTTPPLDPFTVFSLTSSLIGVATVVVNLRWHRSEIVHAPATSNFGISATSRSEFAHSLRRYCEALVAELDRYDREVNWSDRELTPLEAQVETERRKRVRPTIERDLVGAIHRDRVSSVFLVLGDPGSGKSVSLRRLVRLLCNQAEQSVIVPVYANLREYPAQDEPTTESLVKFVHQMALRQTGRDGRAFLETYYEIFRKERSTFLRSRFL